MIEYNSHIKLDNGFSTNDITIITTSVFISGKIISNSIIGGRRIDSSNSRCTLIFRLSDTVCNGDRGNSHSSTLHVRCSIKSYARGTLMIRRIKSRAHSAIRIRHYNGEVIIQKNDLPQQFDEWRRSAVELESIDVQNRMSEYVWRRTKPPIKRYLL